MPRLFRALGLEEEEGEEEAAAGGASRLRGSPPGRRNGRARRQGHRTCRREVMAASDSTA